MAQQTGPPTLNRLIDGTPRGERERLLARCETVDLALGTLLCEQHRPLAHAHLPLTGIVSLVARVDSHPPMELGMIGSEGIVGVSLPLGIAEAPQQAIVRAAGTALRIESAGLQALLADSPGLLRVLHGYLFDLLVQQSQTTVCIHFHVVEARLARWLLMTDDRTRGDRFFLTHQSLADLLGVQRSAVTIAAGVLKQDGLIDYARGELRILDRHGLEHAACSCYAAQRGHGRAWSPLDHDRGPGSSAENK